MDRLAELVNRMNSRCEAAGYEDGKQLNWIGNQMDYVQQDVLKFSPMRYDPPQRYAPPPFQPPVATQDYTSLFIDETDMTESLRLDIALTRQQMPPTPVPAKRNSPQRRTVRFSVYEDHVREDAGDADVELYDPDDVIEYNNNDMFAFPQIRPDSEFRKCLHCDRFNVSGSKRCQFCGRVL